MRLAALGAAIAVAAVLYFALRDDAAHAPSGTRAARETERRLPADWDNFVPREPPAADVTYGLTVVVQGPVSGVSIEVRGPGMSRTSRSDATGRCVLSGLRPGFYSVLARSVAGGDGALAGSATVDLRRNREVTVALTAAVVVRGHVYDLDKRAIPGATVVAVASRLTTWADVATDLMQPDAIAAHAAAQADGSYELLLPGAGRYGLRAHAPGFGAEIEPGRRFDAPERGVDFTLVPGRRLEGRVVESEARPVAGALVLAAGYVTGPQDLAPKAETVTDADGRFALTVPSVRWLQVSVSAAGYARWVDRRVAPTGRPLAITLVGGVALRMRIVEAETREPLAGAAVEVALESARSNPAGDVVMEHVGIPANGRTAVLTHRGHIPQRLMLKTTDIVDGVLDVGEVELERGGTVRGTVRAQDTGRPIPGVLVMPFGGSSRTFSLMTADDVRTDERGNYVLTGVPLDAGTIVALHDAYVMDLSKPDLGRLIRGGGLFAKDEVEARLDIELLPAAGVHGTVVGPDGKPVAGARVQEIGGRGFLGEALPIAMSGEDGGFVLNGFKPGLDVQVYASHRDYGSSVRVPVKAGAPDPVVLTLEPATLLRGVVHDEHGAAIEGVLVGVTPRPGGSAPRTGGTYERPTYSDATGVFLLRNPPAGQLAVRFDHDEYAVEQKEITLAAGAPERDLGTIILRRGPTIAGVVVDPDGNPLPAIRLTASREPGKQGKAGRTWSTTTAREDGTFSFHGLSEGAFKLRVAGGQHYADAAVAGAGTKDVRIVVYPAASMEARVMAGGKPVARAAVLAELDGTQLCGASTGDDGGFRLHGLPPHRPFRLRIRHGSYEQKIFDNVNASEGGRAFELDAGARLAGEVVDERGAPVARATVGLWVDGKSTRFARTDEAGRFTVAGPRTGKLEVAMQHSPAGHIRSGRIEVQPGDSAIRIVVETGYFIRGKVVFGKTDGFVRVTAIGADGKVAASVSVPRGDEKFEIRGLRKGTYRLKVSAWTDAREEKTLADLPGIDAGTDNVVLEID